MTDTSDDVINQSRYPIRTVATLTGVNPITLRAWERRYGLITPVRTEKGHRLYSQADIDLIYQVTELLDKGIQISQVQRTIESRERQPTEIVETEGEDVWARYRQQILVAISRFDGRSIDTIYNEALSLYPVDMVTRQLIIPLLQTLGRRWESAEGTVAEEHFFSVYLRNKLGARLHHQSLSQHDATRLVGACLPGEMHEQGLLLFALSAHERQYELVILGADMPLHELPAVVKRSQAKGIVLSASIEPNLQVMELGLPGLVSRVNVPVFVGGRVSTLQQDAIINAGAVALGEDIQQGIKYLDNHLRK